MSASICKVTVTLENGDVLDISNSTFVSVSEMQNRAESKRYTMSVSGYLLKKLPAKPISFLLELTGDN